jgi:hypothetical protein
MTSEEYADHLFGVATGWLGWTPAVALSTPIPQIYIALKARAQWIAMCNGHSDDTPVDRLKSQLRKLKASHDER